MNLQQRINLLSRLGEWMLPPHPDWVAAKEQAALENPWFIPAFIDRASENITRFFLQKDLLEDWTLQYPALQQKQHASTVGLVMAGNIPLVGFHDWLCVFISGHKARVKCSSKDKVLLPCLVSKIIEWEPAVAGQTLFSDMLKGCDAYIATGSNNSSRYFDYYFGRYPNVIRKNKTSAAILTGAETLEDLERLTDDICLYFGLGCRNVTKIYVPEGYDFRPLLEALNKYGYFAEHHWYKNNYDYNLALHILNKKYYMTNGSVLLIEDSSLFSPVSQLNYEYYEDAKQLHMQLQTLPDLQGISGAGYIPFGKAQQPGLANFADGIDSLSFLLQLNGSDPS